MEDIIQLDSVFIVTLLMLLAASSVYYFVVVKLDYWWKRIFHSLAVVIAILLIYGLVYQWGMFVYEGVEKSFMQSLQVVIESVTTAGYGGDSPWESSFMNFLILLMNLTGVALVFLALPLFIIPMVRQAVKLHPPETTDVEDHVIICSNSKRAAVLRDELEAKSIPFVFIDNDPQTVLKLNEAKSRAILGDPTEDKVLQAANIGKARALVADLDDENNAIITLSARNLREDLKIISVASNANVMAYHRYAGSDEVILPRRVLGRSLGEKAMVTLTKKLQGVTRLGSELEITELLVEPDSEIAGKTIRESDIRERFGVSVIGAWFRGEFVANPKPDQIVDDHTILLLAGRHEHLAELRLKTISHNFKRKGKVIIGGYGLVGKVISDRFKEEEIPFRVVDQMEKEGVDVVGDITDKEVLNKAGITDSSTIILALDNDTTTIFTTLVIKNTEPNIEIIARANNTENVSKLYQAGADYVLALSVVTGRMIFSNLLDSYDVLSPDTNYEIVRTKAPRLAGKSLREADIRKKCGCTVVAIHRNGELITNLKADFELEEEDELVLVGNDESINRFMEYAG